MDSGGNEMGFKPPSNSNHCGILWKQGAFYICGAAVALSLGRSGLKGVSSAKVPGKELIIHHKLPVKGFADYSSQVPVKGLLLVPGTAQGLFCQFIKAWMGIYKLIALVPLVGSGCSP